jgi:hypothetical protein
MARPVPRPAPGDPRDLSAFQFAAALVILAVWAIRAGRHAHAERPDPDRQSIAGQRADIRADQAVRLGRCSALSHFP